jgi:simple sugar transport system ATP-binding protein
VGAVSENRLHDGVAPRMSVRDNVVAASYHLPPLSWHGWMVEAQVLAVSNRLLAESGAVARSPKSPIGSLSGGNMQKVVLARELGTRPRLLVASQPSLGLDIGATAAMHQQLGALRDRGAAVLLVSADLDELLALSDRIMVMFRGAIVAHFPAAGVSASTLGPYMTGLRGTPGTQACVRSAFTQAHEEAL